MNEIIQLPDLYKLSLVLSKTIDIETTISPFSRENINRFSEIHKSTLIQLFSRIEISYYFNLFYYDIDYLFNAKLCEKVNAVYSILLINSPNDKMKTPARFHPIFGKKQNYIKHHIIIIYMSFEKVMKDLYKSINNSVLSIDLFNEMAQCRYVNDDDEYDIRFSLKQKNEFDRIILLDETNNRLAEKMISSLSNETANEIINETNITQKRIRAYTDLLIFEEVEDGYLITELFELFEIYRYNNIIVFDYNHSRGLCIPFLILPSQYSRQLYDDLIKYPYAQPLFKTYYVKTYEELANIFDKYIIAKTYVIAQEILKNPTDEDIEKLFYEPLPDPIHKKKKPNKKTRQKIKKKINLIDISTVKENEIVDVDVVVDDDVDVDVVADDDVDVDVVIAEPLRTLQGYVDDETEPIILKPITNNDNYILVKYRKHPYKIIFYKYEYISYADQDNITFMINELYTNNTKFKIFMEEYNTIRVIQSFHKDFNAKDKSIHFNVVFYNTFNITRSAVYHAYITNNVISSLTTITNIL